MIASLPLVGEPAEAQNRPAVQPDYPEVFSARPTEEATALAPEGRTKPMSAAERAKLQADLIAARDRAAAEKREQINQPAPR